jgi:hypothetical protein
MSKVIFVLSGLALFLILNAPAVQAQTVFDKWTALKNFHEVMSQTFHPMEDGNLEPIKTRSLEMSEKAALLNKDIPTEFNTPAIADAAKRLEEGCKTMNDMITNNASDDEIKKSLISMHDVFHEIAGLCSDAAKPDTDKSKTDKSDTEKSDPSK